MVTYRKTVDLYTNSLYSFFNPFTPRVLDGAEFCEVTLTFEYVDETLWSDHSNETSLPVLTHGATCFSRFHKMKFGIFCMWITGVKGVICYFRPVVR